MKNSIGLKENMSGECEECGEHCLECRCNRVNIQWIDCEKEHPKSVWDVVFVTDGEMTCLAFWIEDPKSWYEKDEGGLYEYDEDLEDFVYLEKEWGEPHWRFETKVGPFRGSKECFGTIGYITHWMPLPEPPTCLKSPE